MNQKAVSLYIRLHCPWVLGPYSIADIGVRHQYTGAELASGSLDEGKSLFLEAVRQVYAPLFAVLDRVIAAQSTLQITFSVSGPFLQQALRWDQSIIDKIRTYVASGHAIITAEADAHSLAFFYDRAEFVMQVAKHEQCIAQYFGTQPRVFQVAELAYDDQLAAWADAAGYGVILVDQYQQVDPRFLYRPVRTQAVRLLMRDRQASQQLMAHISGSASGVSGMDFAAQYANSFSPQQQVSGLFIDAISLQETDSQPNWRFLAEFLAAWPSYGRYITPLDAAEQFTPREEVRTAKTSTWLASGDLRSLIGNDLQKEFLHQLYDIKTSVQDSGDAQLQEDWRLLQSVDIVKAMDNTAYNSAPPHEVFLRAMNSLQDIVLRSQHNTTQETELSGRYNVT